MTKKVVFSGSSCTSGVGWNPDNLAENCYDYPGLWVNLCHNQIDKLQNLELVNVSNRGASDAEIFENTVSALGPDVEYLFCQWVSVPRYNFLVGFELWHAGEKLHRVKGKRSFFGIDLNRGDSYDRKYLDNLLDRLLALHHIHGEILKVVRYSSIITKLAENFGTQVAFINGCCPWDDNYFARLENVLPEAYTPFTKKDILNIETRSDEDIFKLYNKLHNEYHEAGGIDSKKWVNLYNSFESMKVDTNFDDGHAGTKTNQLYFQQVSNFLNQQ